MATEIEQLDNICWEIELLAKLCGTNISLDKIGYAAGSLLASSWYVANRSTNPAGAKLCGTSLEEEVEIREWMEFYCTRLRPLLPWQRISKDCLHNALEMLNSHLFMRIFLTGNSLSLADILLYYGLHTYLIEMSHGDKTKYIYVSRWVDQIQHYPELKPFTWAWISLPKAI